MAIVQRKFDSVHDTKPDGFYEDILVIRVPLVKFVLPNATGTTRDKFEPAFLEPLVLKHWRPHWAQNISLKPKRGPVPGHLPQYRIITDLESEKARLENEYGADRQTHLPNVESCFPGDRLWELIRQYGEFVTLRRGTHHDAMLEETKRMIPPDATPYDVLDIGEIMNVGSDEEQEEEIETEDAAAAKQKAADQKARMAEERKKREAIMAKRMEKDAKIASENQRADARREDHDVNARKAPTTKPDTAEPEDGVVGEIIE
jgi:hypothetical protein